MKGDILDSHYLSVCLPVYPVSIRPSVDWIFWSLKKKVLAQCFFTLYTHLYTAFTKKCGNSHSCANFNTKYSTACHILSIALNKNIVFLLYTKYQILLSNILAIMDNNMTESGIPNSALLPSQSKLTFFHVIRNSNFKHIFISLCYLRLIPMLQLITKRYLIILNSI